MLNRAAKLLLNTELFFHSFNNIENGRADRGVLQREIKNLVEALPVGMRVFAAGSRTVFINSTIIFTVKKSTGGCVKHIVLVLVNMQILLDEF